MQEPLERRGAPIPTVDRWTREALPDEIQWKPTRQRQWRIFKFARLVNRRREALRREVIAFISYPPPVDIRPRFSEVGLEEAFQALATKWREETGHLSSITKMVMHPCYQRIIGLGPDVLPILLNELGRQPDYWFWALRAITGEDPVAEEDAGNIPKMAEAWLEWGKQRGFIDVDPPRIYFPQSAPV
jgi:hypothetical protein